MTFLRGEFYRFRFSMLFAALIIGLSWFVWEYWGTMDAAEASYPQEFTQEFIIDTVNRVESSDTPIPILFYTCSRSGNTSIKIKYFAVYDISTGVGLPQWSSPESAKTIIYKSFIDGEIPGYSDHYHLITYFLNDGSANGTMPNWTPLTAENLGYHGGQTITLRARILYDMGVTGEKQVEKDMKIYVADSPWPTFTNWYAGDSHYHSWKTYNLYEIGGPTEAVSLSARAVGLQWLTVTDHSCDLIMEGHEADWPTLGTEVKTLSNADFVMIRAEEVTTKGNYGIIGIRHLLAFDFDNLILGDQVGNPYYFNEILGQGPYNDNLQSQNGFGYSAHPGRWEDSWFESEMSWPDVDNDIAFHIPTFKGLEFLNNPSPYYAENAFHPWGSNPHNGDWQSYDANWRASTIDGAADWDRLNSMGLASARKFFCLGGSDAHGDLNFYTGVDVAALLDFEYDTDARDYAIGKARTIAYLPSGLSEENVLLALRNGQTIITDGPAMIFGIDTDGDGSFYGANDLRIADGPANVSSSAHIVGSFKSTREFGRVRAIYFYVGTEGTGRNPYLCSSIVMLPNEYEGSFSLPISQISELMARQNQRLYIRAECYTFNPANGTPHGGNPTNASHNTDVRDYDYRCWANPIWITVTN